TATATATITSADKDAYKEVTFSVDDETLVSVSPTKASSATQTLTLTGKAPGTTKLKAKHKDTECASVKVNVIKLELKKSDDSALANPCRIGITANGHDRTQHFKAICTPASEVSNVTVTVGNNLTLSNQKTTGGTITFDVVGTAQSTTAGDTFIQATHAVGGAMVKAPVSVVVPAAIGTPHPQFPRTVVTPQNVAMTNATTPADTTLGNGITQVRTGYSISLPVLVVDQFGVSIGDIYRGADVFENDPAGNFNCINSVIDVNGVYFDIVGYGEPIGGPIPSTVPDLNGGAPIPNPLIQQRVAGATAPLQQDHLLEQRISVSIDNTWVLQPPPAIVRDVFIFTPQPPDYPGVSIEVEWP
ncbi:MAG: hypothetical protein V1899_00230, partial [Planctomycetota bacterium]